MIEARTTGRPERAGERPRLKVLLAAPRGFCAGVRRAIDAVDDALKLHGAPVYVRRAIVHNREVVADLEARGARFVEELDEVPAGGVVIFSAHGVAPAIRAEAERLGLTAFDAVCPLVAKVHHEVARHSRAGRRVILVGHAGHPEIEGTRGHVTGAPALLVSSVADVQALDLPSDRPVAYAVQTTYSVAEAAVIIAALEARFGDLAGPPTSDICYATTNRQAAVQAIAGQSDAMIIVGADFSSNARRLAEVAAQGCAQVQLVEGPDSLDWRLVEGVDTVGISAAASTPDSSVEAVLEVLAGRFTLAVEEVEVVRETTTFRRLAIS